MNKLVFNGVEVIKEEFYESKEGINLKDVNVSNIIVSVKVKGNNDISKILVGYIIDDNVVPLCLILPQISGWIKYFENSGKNTRFKFEDHEMYLKYNEIWNKIRELLNGVKLSNDPIYDGNYIKTKVKTFSEVIKTLFDGGEISNEKIEYTCLTCISIDSVLRVDKKYYPQVYLEQCKYKVKKREVL